MTARGMGWTFIVVTTLVAPLSGCGLHGKPEIQRKASPPAASRTRVAPANAEATSPEAARSPGPDLVVAPGIVEPWGGQTDLSAQEPGWIARIAVKEGETLQAGQVLATLDDEAQRHSVDLASADVAASEAELAKVEHGATPEELRQVQADFAAASARSALARSAAARTLRLRDQAAVPESEADRAAADTQVQMALAERAEARLHELRRGPRAEDRNASRARVKAAQARLRLAEVSLARRRIVAPAVGTVLLSRFHAGEFYTPGVGSLFVLGDMNRLQVRLEVDEIDALAVVPGAPCALYSDAGVRLAEGVVVRLAPKMGRRALAIESPTARTDVRIREVFVEIPATSRLIPGQRVWGHTSRPTNAQGSASRLSKQG